MRGHIRKRYKDSWNITVDTREYLVRDNGQ
jgi:hypothetical protein